MDPLLAAAALSGDESYLRAAIGVCKSNNNDYSPLLTQHMSITDEEKIGNIFHLAAWNGHLGFFRVGMEELPAEVKQKLVCGEASGDESMNPLHVAALKGQHQIVELICEFYKSLPSNLLPLPENRRPWVGKDSLGSTPLMLAIEKGKEESARAILSMSMSMGLTDGVCRIDGEEGMSPLFAAVEKGYYTVAKQILEYDASCSVAGKHGSTPLHVINKDPDSPPQDYTEVCRLLLEKHPDMIKTTDNDGSTVLHAWAKNGNAWPLEFIMQSDKVAEERKRDLVGLIDAPDNHGQNPFHIAAQSKSEKVARILARIYNNERANQGDQARVAPWLVTNNGDTPVKLAIDSSLTPASLTLACTIIKEGNDKHLFRVIEEGDNKLAKAILSIQHQYGWTTTPRGHRFLHDAHRHSGRVLKWLAETLPDLSPEVDNFVKESLQAASEIGLTQYVELMLKKHPHALTERDLVWKEACTRGHLSTVNAFIENCPNFWGLCLKKKDTPLHHLGIKCYNNQCKKLLKHPVMKKSKNFQDSIGATPLHQAITNRNIHVTEMLLTDDGVDRTIKDKKGKTPMDLLVEECKKSREWDEMCRLNGIVPGLKTSYFQNKTNMLEVRNTLSVVAALLATITFTAAFTLPGGVKNESTGKAILAQKAAFTVFLLADTCALCCSMLVLVCLVWSMICDHNRSLWLIDKSLPVLLLALYTTLLAFITGIYVVMPRKTWWATLLIVIICAVFFILSRRCTMYRLVDIFCPALNRKTYQDEVKALEEGNAGIKTE